MKEMWDYENGTMGPEKEKGTLIHCKKDQLYHKYLNL